MAVTTTLGRAFYDQDTERHLALARERNRRYRVKHRDRLRVERREKYLRLREKEAATIRRWQEANPEKRRAHGVLAYALRMGRIAKEPCLFCDEMKVVGHHHDYALPLDVTWLCARHHSIAHGSGGV